MKRRKLIKGTFFLNVLTQFFYWVAAAGSTAGGASTAGATGAVSGDGVAGAVAAGWSVGKPAAALLDIKDLFCFAEKKARPKQVTKKKVAKIVVVLIINAFVWDPKSDSAAAILCVNPPCLPGWIKMIIISRIQIKACKTIIGIIFSLILSVEKT